MADIPVGDPGLAGGITQSEFTQRDIWISTTPEIWGEEVEVANTNAAVTYEFLSVVKLDTDGRITGLANHVEGSNVAGAKGILAYKVTSKTSGTAFPKAFIYKSGHPNIDKLVYHAATFDTDAKKLNAFKGAATPINIRPGLNRYHRA